MALKFSLREQLLLKIYYSHFLDAKMYGNFSNKGESERSPSEKCGEKILENKRKSAESEQNTKAEISVKDGENKNYRNFITYKYIKMLF